MTFRKRIIAATPMICLIIFLLLGFCADAWHPGWIVFLAIPVVPMLLNPKGILGLYPALCVIAYVIIGAVWGIWHPGWIIFLTIPVVEILFGGIRKK